MSDFSMPASQMTTQKLLPYQIAINLPLFDYAAASSDLPRLSRWISLKPIYVRGSDYHFHNRIRSA